MLSDENVHEDFTNWGMSFIVFYEHSLSCLLVWTRYNLRNGCCVKFMLTLTSKRWMLSYRSQFDASGSWLKDEWMQLNSSNKFLVGVPRVRLYFPLFFLSLVEIRVCSWSHDFNDWDLAYLHGLVPCFRDHTYILNWPYLIDHTYRRNWPLPAGDFQGRWNKQLKWT